MTVNDPRLRSLLRQADKVASNGKIAAAAQLYRQILDENPQVVDAWLGLASVLPDEAARKEAYQKAYDLDPANETAKAGLRGETVRPAPPDLPVTPIEKPKPSVTREPKVQTAVAPESVAPVATPLPDPEPGANSEFELVCYRHPNRQTGLRCYTCNKPICIKCANKTPVGYSCPDCLRSLQDSYYTATLLDYVLAFIVTLPLSIVAAYFVGFIGFFVIFLAPVVGTALGRIIFMVVRRRRGRWLPQMVAGVLILGAALLILVGFGSLIWTGLYAVLAAASVYYYMKI